MKIHGAFAAALMAGSLLTGVFCLSAAAQDVRTTVVDETGGVITPLLGDAAYARTAITGVEAGASHIRLANIKDDTVRNYVEIYGLHDRATLGSFTVDVPAKGAVQFQPESMIFSIAPLNWDQPIVLYVENGRDKQLW